MSEARILVVEDEAVVALDLRNRLDRLGYKVVMTTGRGDEAIQLCEKLQPDLILMDIRLQGPVDGITAAESIRSQYHLPVVYLTAHADDSTVARARLTEPFGYILKPFDERELRTVIEMALYKHQAERKLQLSERRFATTLASIGDAVISTDEMGRICFMNPVAESLTGWKIGDAQNLSLTTVFEIISEETRDTVDNPVDRVLAEGVQVGLANHTILVRRDGREIPIDDCAAPILDDSGKVTGAVLVFRDVSETRRIEDQLRQSQKMEAIGQLAGGIAHDFNNMLTVILNYCQVLMEQAGPNHAWSNQINEIRRAAERSAELTKQLLVFCRKQFVRPTIVELNEMVQQNEQMLRRLISERIELKIKLQPNAGSIVADQNELHQILINLVVNSSDAIYEQGTIEIETDNVLVAPNQFPNIVAGIYNVLRVRDNGHGIASNVIDRVFDPFFTTKEIGKGTGLGLSIVYGIVQQCQGYIQVDSNVGQGSTFTIYFPPAGEKAPVAKRAEPPTVQNGNETILLVEDERALRMFCYEFLSSCGYRVLTAENGAEAIDVASKSNEKIDLVVTDVIMPTMSAKLMSTILLQHRPNLKILFMSGYNNEDFVDLKQELPKTRFLQKPFAISELARTIREILEENELPRK